jgi:hypothetical protein
MNSVGSRNKGNQFERDMCRKMSLWISRGERTDLFMRNVASGGAFTMSLKRGSALGVGGDMMAVHPLAHAFLDVFLTEYKHWRALNFEAALWNNRGEFARVITKAEKQAQEAGRHCFIVAKQNFRAPILLMPNDIGVRCAAPGLVYHSLWNARVFACLLDDALKADPAEFLLRAKDE